MDLELAVKKYEAIIAPENYKRPKPIFTKAMLERAQKAVTDMGYQSLLVGNKTGVNTNPFSMNINPNFQQYTKIKK